MNIVIPMAGLGTRFSQEGFKEPKPLIKINGKTLVEHSIESLNLDGRYIFITRGYENVDYNLQLSEILKSIVPDCTEIQINQTTRGAAETCLFAKDLINNESPLVITNCDQRLEWNASDFVSYIKDDMDGIIVTHDSINPKHSFAVVNEDNDVISMHEKEPVSSHALIGLHYWKHGYDFVTSAETLLELFSKNNRPECYISETYNFLINNWKKIKAYDINPSEYIPLGTPYDLSIYKGMTKEYFTEKPKTIFCDIDGTILKHAHRFSDINDDNLKVLPGVLEKFNEWDSIGHTIILCTARKESAREMTERHLKSLGICYDQLIMGLTSGQRVLINDKINNDCNDRAVGINLLTDRGFKYTDWEGCGL